jgi:predicted component of type VI protein secretion system
VSSIHCRIWMELDAGLNDGRILVEDLSSNGLYVEGARLGKGRRTQLDSGYEISFGPPSTDLTEDLRMSLVW